MIDANTQFFAILTTVGKAKQANADALGIPWKLTEMGVGDANNIDPVIPAEGQTKLINEWRRKPLNRLFIDPVNPAVIIAEQIIPADEGGKWIREIGLYDADGDLVAVANCAPSFKPLLSQGSGRTQIVRMNFIVSSSGNIQLKIDPAVVLATRTYVDAAILEVLPKDKTAGQYTRVRINDRGIVQSGDNPDTLAELGIKDSYTKTEVGGLVAQASEVKLGTAKIATQVLTDAGADDTTIVTPKKLRWGFQILKSTAGYVVFPSWLGGLILQWGGGVTSAGGIASVALPLVFPNAMLKAFVSASGTNSVATVGAVAANSIGLNCFVGSTGAGKSENVQFLVIGH